MGAKSLYQSTRNLPISLYLFVLKTVAGSAGPADYDCRQAKDCNRVAQKGGFDPSLYFSGSDEKREEVKSENPFLGEMTEGESLQYLGLRKETK